jgi:hypothetical protein
MCEIEIRSRRGVVVRASKKVSSAKDVESPQEEIEDLRAYNQQESY